MKTPSLYIKHFRIACKYNNIFSIFDLHELSSLLQKMGYIIMRPLPPPRFGARAIFKGNIARKQGKIVVDVNSKKIIGVFSQDPQLAVNEFINIEDTFKKEVLINLKPHFYEVLVEAEFFTSQNPLNIISKVGEEVEALKELNKIMGDTTLFGLRFRRKNQNPDSPEWLDIKILPSIIRADKAYLIQIVFRSKNRKKATSFGEKTMKYITDIVNCLEQQVLNKTP